MSESSARMGRKLGVIINTHSNADHIGACILEKYGLSFIYDIESYKSSIEQINTIRAECYVPSHGEIVTEIIETAELNHAQYVLIGSTIKSFLSYLYINDKLTCTFTGNRMLRRQNK